MKAPLYLAYGLFLVGSYGWLNYTGWAAGTLKERKVAPHSLRSNPGSYRSTYGGGYGGHIPSGPSGK
jgi:hypothetical protein